MFVNHYSSRSIFRKKVLWIARFYLFCLYNKNFRPTYKSTKKHILFAVSKSNMVDLKIFLKICKIEKFEFFLEGYQNLSFQTLSKRSFFKKDLWNCHFFAKCIFLQFPGKIEQNFKYIINPYDCVLKNANFSINTT